VTPIYNSARRFQFWSYIVSHGTLVIRSPLSSFEDQTTNIDLIFFGVTELHLVRYFDGLTLSKADDILDDPHSKRFLLQSNGSTYFVDALAVSVYENQLDTFEFYHPVNGPEDLGRRIAHSSG
jgi:hypothetical protein